MCHIWALRPCFHNIDHHHCFFPNITVSEYEVLKAYHLYFIYNTNHIFTSTKEVLNSWPFICLFVHLLVSRITQLLLVGSLWIKKREDGSWSNLIPLNLKLIFITSRIKKNQRSRISHLPIIELHSIDLFKNHTCLGGGLSSSSALVKFFKPQFSYFSNQLWYFYNFVLFISF